MKFASLRRSSRRFLALFLAAAGALGLSVARAKEITTGDVRITAAGAREGKAAVTPWSGTWWPMADGELALGWNGTGADFTYDATTKRWSRALTQLNPHVRRRSRRARQPARRRLLRHLRQRLRRQHSPNNRPLLSRSRCRTSVTSRTWKSSKCSSKRAIRS